MAKEKKKEEKPFEIDFGLGGLFKGIEKLVDLAAALKEAGGEIKKEGEIDLSHLRKGMKGIYGFSVKSAVGGKPIVEPFGNIKKTPKGPVVKEEREPMVDVFDEKDHILIVAELPGVSKESIDFEIKGDILNITAKTKERKYAKEVLLPSAVDAKAVTSSYKNGMLEIKLRKPKKK